MPYDFASSRQQREILERSCYSEKDYPVKKEESNCFVS